MSTDLGHKKDRLGRLLEESGKTAPELYKSAGFSRQRWCYYRSHQETLTRVVLEKLYAASGLSEAKFFDIFLRP